MDFATEDLVGPIQDALEKTAQGLYEGGQVVAAADKEFFHEQALLMAQLAADLALATTEEDQARILDAMEQVGVTAELRVARRRFQLSEIAQEQLKNIIKVSIDTLLHFLRRVILGV